MNIMIIIVSLYAYVASLAMWSRCAKAMAMNLVAEATKNASMMMMDTHENLS